MLTDTERANNAYRSRKRARELAQLQAVPVGQSPWTPQRSPGFMRRLTRHKLTLVKLLGGKVAT